MLFKIIIFFIYFFLCYAYLKLESMKNKTCIKLHRGYFILLGGLVFLPGQRQKLEKIGTKMKKNNSKNGKFMLVFNV